MNAPQRQVDRKGFVTNLRLSGLVTTAQLTEVEKLQPHITRGRPFARVVIERGFLTRFQAERLLAGRTQGFQLGQYKILDQIGRGGMGRVFKAEHRTMGRIVALKVLSPGLIDTERAQELFLREVRAAARLTHPNIVTAYDANEVSGRFYLVLEFVDGPNLDQLVRAQGPLAVGLACDYIRQAALGLQCAHAVGMVHRDLKPSNILVQRRGPDDSAPGLVKISDFGLARLHTPNAPSGAKLSHHAGTILTKENTVMGTPDYLSPEQARCLHKTDIRSDIYSLGCTLYFLLTGQPPFPGGNSLEKLIRHTTEQPAVLAKSRSDVPAPVQAVLDRMMAKHPAERYQTPAELAAALEPFAVSGAIPWAPPPSASPYLDENETPASNADEADATVDFNSSDDMAALAAVASRDKTPAPRAAITRKARIVKRPRWGWRLVWFGLAAALLGAAGYLGYYFYQYGQLPFVNVR
jgi:serine/threonine-protein kinase